MSTLRFWVLVLVIGGIIGIILPIIDVYISREDRKKLKEHKNESKLIITKRHRLNLLVYLFYPASVSLAAVFLYFIESFSDTIVSLSDSVISYVSLIYAVLVLSVFYFVCLFLVMMALERASNYFLRVYFEKKYNVIVLDDEKHFIY